MPADHMMTLNFSFHPTDFIYRSLGDTSRHPVWDFGTLLPFQDISLSPAAAFFSYGLGVFEGLKAHRTVDGEIVLFRPEMNAKRFQRSAEMLLMAPFPVEQFIQAVCEMVRKNERHLPLSNQGALYLRPMEHAIEPKLGHGPCSHFSVIMFASPVGSYFSEEKGRGLNLKVVEQGRVAPGGVGSAKAMGNYAGSLRITAEGRAQGFDDVLFLDAQHKKFISETSGSNVFVLLKSCTLVTPPLDDQILPGIVRDTVLHYAREVLSLKTEERFISIREALSNGEEMFCTGTAWTVKSIDTLCYKEQTHSFPKHGLGTELAKNLNEIQTGQKADLFSWLLKV